TETVEPRDNWYRPALARWPPCRRSLPLGSTARRRGTPPHELRAPSARGAGIPARRTLHRAGRPAGATLPSSAAHHVLRTVLRATHRDARHHVRGALRSRAAHRRSDASARGGAGHISPAALRTAAG